MDSTEDLCKHHKIQRNCYTCFVNREWSFDEDKTPLDTLHETISELRVRISKLEEYKRLQDDQNTEVNKNIFDLNDFRNGQISVNSIHVKHIDNLDEHRKKQIDENRAVSKSLDDIREDIRELTQRNNGLEFSLAIVPKNLENMVEINFNDLNERLQKLENLSDFKKLEACVLDGAQTHLTCLKLEARVKELEENSIRVLDVFKEELMKKIDEVKTVEQVRETAKKWREYFDENEAKLNEENQKMLEKLHMQKHKISIDPGSLDTTVIRCVGTGTIPAETLCMDKFAAPKNPGLSFDEAFHAFLTGKSIKQKGGTRFTLANPNAHTFTPNEILANDWEICE